MNVDMRSIITAVALVGACLCGQNLMAQNLVVGTCTNAANPYTTIHDAVSNAPSGATVLVCPGNYPEQVVISEPLTLTGIQSGNADAVHITAPSVGVQTNTTFTTINDSGSQVSYPVAAQVWVHDTTGVTMSNLTVDGTGTDNNCSGLLIGIYLQNASGTVKDVLTKDQNSCSSGVGAAVESDASGTSTVTVKDSSFASWSFFGFWAHGPGVNATFQSNAVEGPGPSVGVNDVTYEMATGTIDNNSLLDALTSGSVDINSASCGIGLQLPTAPVTVTGNVIGNTQCGVALYYANGNTISSNIIFGTHATAGVYVCGNGNTVTGNAISDSAPAGIELSCADLPSGGIYSGATANNNNISKNIINGALDGVLTQSGTTGNRLKDNKFFNVGAVSQQQ